MTEFLNHNITIGDYVFGCLTLFAVSVIAKILKELW